MVNKLAQLEAVLYVAGDNGIEQSNLTKLLGINQQQLTDLVNNLNTKYRKDNTAALQIIHLNNLYKMTTNPQVSSIVESYFAKDLSQNLSQSALEILSIVAYRQPITRTEIDEIRGVNSSGAIQTLIWRGLIKTNGKKDVPGRPNLYITTDYFLQYFNYHSLADLPVIEEFEDTSFDENGENDLFAQKGIVDTNLMNMKKGIN